jgi:hypothetical protein
MQNYSTHIFGACFNISGFFLFTVHETQTKESDTEMVKIKQKTEYSGVPTASGVEKFHCVHIRECIQKFPE